MTGEILIFGGTTEGRQVSAYLSEKQAAHTVCVATEYGEEVLDPGPYLTVHTGRMDEQAIRSFLGGKTYVLIVDATHPYAQEASENIRAAAEAAQVPYLRFLRPDQEEPEKRSGCAFGPVYVNTAQEAADYLDQRQGRIFLTTGSKELPVFAERISDKSRLTVRILPTQEALAACRSLGLTGKQICAMQGPFSAGMNAAMLRQSGASFLVTKQSGEAGGFPEKMDAASLCRVQAVVIRRPEETGASWEEVRARLDGVLREGPAGEEVSCRISCVGIGMGTTDTLTREAAQAILQAEVIFGAQRMLSCARALFDEERPDGTDLPLLVPEYDAEKIRAWLQDHPEIQSAVILMSGDVGFYSGAQRIAEVFPAEDVHDICGVSSVSYFASKIPTAWQDALLLSAHAKEPALLNDVREYRKIFLLAGTGADVRRMMRQLEDAGMGQVRVTAGSRLSYPDEKIESGHPADFLSYPDRALPILFIENPAAARPVTPGIPDERFVRGKVPMTKEEIRILSVSKLRLKKDSVVCDVGAGTGSVAVECARLCTAGQVYAVEQNPEGIRLIRENARKFHLSNLTAVKGTAPEILRSLPAPTHAFIGGSSHQMAAIIDALRQKNPAVRIVINTVTLESLAEAVRILEDAAFSDAEIVQVSVAKSRDLGDCHLMAAQNPVSVISFGGEKTDD